MTMRLLHWFKKQRDTYTPTLNPTKSAKSLGLLEEMEAKDQKLQGSSKRESKDQKLELGSSALESKDQKIGSSLMEDEVQQVDHDASKKKENNDMKELRITSGPYTREKLKIILIC
ncbi:unnamed protein product [Trifolium pratense]|uniref:Uncharacterized protein n=1 Tax=Trifolium pratense TaxID=57577 RepID=A0ACB0L9R1_TRIPR|nr:unnamed protein product [Trifolium pratense]